MHSRFTAVVQRRDFFVFPEEFPEEISPRAVSRCALRSRLSRRHIGEEFNYKENFSGGNAYTCNISP